MKLVVKNVLFTLVVPGTVGAYVPLLLTQGRIPNTRFPGLLALPLFAIALILYVWSVWTFASRGKATPLPIDAPKVLVVQGPYRYTRNPMYMGLVSALVGWLILYRTFALLLYTIGVAIVVSAFVILYEEPHLRNAFGKQYDAYRATVPRWFPRPSRPVRPERPLTW